VFIAVLAACDAMVGKYSSRVLVSLNDATLIRRRLRPLSYYQAKSIKQNLYDVAREQLSKPARPDSATGKRGFVQRQNHQIRTREEPVQAEAKKLEAQRDEARQARSSPASTAAGWVAVSISQISIAMGSICLVVKKKPLWYLSVFLALIAAAEMMRVWLW